MTQEIKCLDHGFVRLVDSMGDDSAIVQAARVSYGDGTKTTREDEELINYLLRHNHTTPFEMVEFKFHAKMPIFIARQWIRHRTASVNEYSMRYSQPKDEFYLPDPEHLMPQSKTNKQGRQGKIEDKVKGSIIDHIRRHSDTSMNLYKTLSNADDFGEGIDYPGLARELSRMVLPVNYYTEWYWKIDLHNLLHFLKLRMDSHAQYEIRVYANAMYEIIKKIVPAACNAFEEYRLNAMTLSRKEQRVFAHLMTVGFNKPLDKQIQAADFSQGEWNELMAKIKKIQLQ